MNEFNKFDLYTKDGVAVTSSVPLPAEGQSASDCVEHLWEYYDGLMQKYHLAGPLIW